MSDRLKNTINRFAKDESGATAIEYSLIASLIFLAILVSIQNVMDDQADNYGKISDAVQEVVNP